MMGGFCWKIGMLNQWDFQGPKIRIPKDMEMFKYLHMYI